MEPGNHITFKEDAPEIAAELLKMEEEGKILPDLDPEALKDTPILAQFVSMLNDPHHVRGNARMLERSLKEGWLVPEDTSKWPLSVAERRWVVTTTLRLLNATANCGKARAFATLAKLLQGMQNDAGQNDSGAPRGPTTNLQVNVNMNPIDQLHDEAQKMQPILPAGMKNNEE